MQLPGIEPETSRVWGERDNQLHHNCFQYSTTNNFLYPT